jgi:molybdate transport system substrate-binding protein
VESGNAPLGFVASSQITHPGRPIPGSCWVIPHSLYTPIEQQAVQISASAATGQFMAFVRTPEAREIIHGFGYSTPETR